MPDESHRIRQFHKHQSRPIRKETVMSRFTRITRPPALALACRAIAFTVVAALAACAEHGNPTSPSTSVIPSVPRLTTLVVAQTELTADAIGRILPALEKDAATPVGNALRTLDAKLRDASASTNAKARAAATVQSVLAQFTDPARGDAADLDAMRLEVDEIRASLV
jgi:hypothetical protein